MTVFVMVPDKFVNVDGKFLQLEKLPESPIKGLHALHWDGEKGEAEIHEPVYQNYQFDNTEYDKFITPYVNAYNEYYNVLIKQQEERDAWYKEMRASKEQCFIRLREERDKRLAACDYIMTTDVYNSLSDTKKAEWTAYRQALRDITELEGAPWDGGDDGVTVPWPTMPSK